MFNNSFNYKMKQVLLKSMLLLCALTFGVTNLWADGEAQTKTKYVLTAPKDIQATDIVVVADTAAKVAIANNAADGKAPSATAIKLKRQVEYYQVSEQAHEEHKDKLGGKEEIVTTYTYTEGWTTNPIMSSNFHDPAYQKKNFVLTTADSEGWQAEKVTFGAFQLAENQIGSIMGDVPVELRIDSAMIVAMNKECQQVIQRQFGGKSDSMKLVHIADNVLYYGFSPSSPAVGDVRITFTKVMPAKVSIIAKQTGNSFTKFKAKNGKTFQTLVMGERPAAGSAG